MNWWGFCLAKQILPIRYAASFSDFQTPDSVITLKSYAFEELIAELGSAFLCAQFEIKQLGRDDHARYIKSWLQALKNDKKLIFKASAQAQKAIDFLNSKQEA